MPTLRQLAKNGRLKGPDALAIAALNDVLGRVHANVAGETVARVRKALVDAGERASICFAPGQLDEYAAEIAAGRKVTFE